MRGSDASDGLGVSGFKCFHLNEGEKCFLMSKNLYHTDMLYQLRSSQENSLQQVA